MRVVPEQKVACPECSESLPTEQASRTMQELRLLDDDADKRAAGWIEQRCYTVA